MTTCAAAGFPGDLQVGSPTNSSASDANITGTVGPNAGSVQPGRGQELNVTINSGASVVISAVVVKGSDGFNVYSQARHLPPELLRRSTTSPR